MVSVEKHYDLLIANGNDPVNDSIELQNYMNKWDGDIFVENLKLDKSKSVLEIGCGTGRILKKIIGTFKNYTGIDISSKTIERAKEHFKDKNISFITDDFISHEFNCRYDVVYSSLTFMHIKEKSIALSKIYSLLNLGGIFVLSIDKNQNGFIDTGYSKIEVYPDTKENISSLLKDIGFQDIKIKEIDNAYIISAERA